MVDDVDSVSHVQPAGGTLAATQNSARPSRASAYMQAVTDAIVLSAQARRVMNELSQGQTVAEAWLSHLTEPPDPSARAVAAGGAGNAAQDDPNSQAAMQAAMNQAMSDLSWLFDAMSPPRVDTNAVAKVLAERMAADAVGHNPPLPQVVARADRTGTVAALYVENLSVTAGGGKTTASVERVALTTVDPSLARSTQGADRPLVVDVGGDAGKVAADTLPPTPAEREQERQQERARSLLLVRLGGQTQPQGTLHVKLDVLLPLG